MQVQAATPSSRAGMVYRANECTLSSKCPLCPPSSYLDRNAQVRLSTFFIGLLSELWLHQNEYYVNAATMEPTLSGGAYEAPSADILRMVGVVERHVLAMDMEAMSEGMLRGSAVPVSGMDELSLYNPADVVRR